MSNRTPMVQAWIETFQRSTQPNEDCRICGWPHRKGMMCGSTFGEVRLGGNSFYIDRSNVDCMQHFMSQPRKGFHWKGGTYFAGEEEGVRISFVSRFNNTPHVESWVIPWLIWDSIKGSVERERLRSEPTGEQS